MRVRSYLMAALFTLGAVADLGAVEPENSVVKIIAHRQEPIWNEPWRFQQVQRATGSGFLIDDRLIMTNAHVVSWAKQIRVMRHQDPRPYPAEVVYVGHDCDLAVLKVLEDDFYENMKSLKFGDLPEVRSTVLTYGYPAGGQQISYTKGVVSRIEMQGYVHSGRRTFLTVQTDAAINPGNSGGPVLQGEKVVGVSFQGTRALENTGFFIPPNVISHFLDDIKDGTYHGFPDAGIVVSPLLNPAQRRYLKMPDDSSGARIDSVISPFPETKKRLFPDDVLLKVEGYDVGSDGMIQFKGNRVHAGVAFDSAQHGEVVDLVIWREGKKIDVQLPVYYNDADRIEGNQYDTPPRYYIYGGLIFTPLCRDYLKALGANWRDLLTDKAVYEMSYSRRAGGEWWPEPIVLAGILPHEVNADFRAAGSSLVLEINGVPIRKLEDVIEALEGNENEHDLFVFDPHRRVEAMDRTKAIEASEAILSEYRVQEDRRL
jgi:S1-C subfamily serine protease